MQPPSNGALEKQQATASSERPKRGCRLRFPLSALDVLRSSQVVLFELELMDRQKGR